MVSMNNNIKTIVDIGLALAGPQKPLISLAIKGAYQLYNAARELNAVPSELLAIVQQEVSKGYIDADQLIERCKAEHDIAEAKLDNSLK